MQTAPAATKEHCPRDMVHVKGTHPEGIRYKCTATKWGLCSAYEEGNLRVEGATHPISACVDRYEAPNREGEPPLVMQSAEDGEAWCKANGKRLCTEYEWETACEGDARRPHGYGWRVDETCNMTKPWKTVNNSFIAAGGELAKREAERLWQGEAAGSRPGCRAEPGYPLDMVGNAEEWVRANRRYRWPVVMMGGHWAKPWQTCRGTNWAHEPSFRYYETGFRCCKDPTP